MLGKLQGLDIFRMAPSKVTEQTVMGSLLTLSVIAISIYFVFFELNSSLNEVINAEMVFADLKVGQSRDNRCRICELLSILTFLDCLVKWWTFSSWLVRVENIRSADNTSQTTVSSP